MIILFRFQENIETKGKLKIHMIWFGERGYFEGDHGFICIEYLTVNLIFLSFIEKNALK